MYNYRVIDFKKPGRMLALFRKEYVEKHRNDLIVFNANILTKKKGRVWVGDLNITLDEPELKRFANELGEDIYIFQEADSRTRDKNKWNLYVVKVEYHGSLVRNQL